MNRNIRILNNENSKKTVEEKAKGFFSKLFLSGERSAGCNSDNYDKSYCPAQDTKVIRIHRGTEDISDEDKKASVKTDAAYPEVPSETNNYPSVNEDGYPDVPLDTDSRNLNAENYDTPEYDDYMHEYTNQSSGYDFSFERNHQSNPNRNRNGHLNADDMIPTNTTIILPNGEEMTTPEDMSVSFLIDCLSEACSMSGNEENLFYDDNGNIVIRNPKIRYI